MKITDYPDAVLKDAVIYVHGGPCTEPCDALFNCVQEAISTKQICAPLCVRIEEAAGTGRWPMRWRATIAFKTSARALRTIKIRAGGGQLALQVTSLVYLGELYSRLGWITTDIGALLP